jgi:Tol biopolymer transport system component
MAPGDTSIYVGGVARLRGTVTDRWNNTYADPVTWTTTTGSIVKVTTSGVATGIAIGRATLVAAGSGFRDSISISVVPPGVIAGDLTPAYSGARHQLIVVNTDGSGKSALSTGPGDNCGFIDIDWLPDRSGLIYAGSRFNSVCFDLRLMITTLSGTTRLVRPDTAPLAGERTPSYSPDGIWIYFGGIPEHQNLEFWRVPSNGTGAERLGPLADWYDVDGYPSPSPDGKQVVYSSNRTYRNSDRQTLKLFDVASRTSRDLLIEGFAPRWSPKGDLIAFISGGNYYVVRPDGSGQRRIATGKYNADRPSWSPDGRYLLVSATDPKASAPVYGRFAIVDVETGAVLPLGWTSQMFSPSWRP